MEILGIYFLEPREKRVERILRKPATERSDSELMLLSEEDRLESLIALERVEDSRAQLVNATAEYRRPPSSDHEAMVAQNSARRRKSILLIHQNTRRKRLGIKEEKNDFHPAF